jgi:acylphosphatase
MAEKERARLTASVRGHVQGVGFRWAVQARAEELALTGYAANQADGRVDVVAEGDRSVCEQLLEWLRGGQTPGQVMAVSERWSAPQDDLHDFSTR